jgi:hypothetical protein
VKKVKHQQQEFKMILDIIKVILNFGLPSSEFREKYYTEENEKRKAMLRQIKLKKCTSSRYKLLNPLLSRPKEISEFITHTEWVDLLIEQNICLGRSDITTNVYVKDDFNPRDILQDETVKKLIEANVLIPDSYKAS